MQVECFDQEGVSHMREYVDAVECVAQLGWTMTKVVPEPVQKAPEVLSEKGAGEITAAPTSAGWKKP